MASRSAIKVLTAAAILTVFGLGAWLVMHRPAAEVLRNPQPPARPSEPVVPDDGLAAVTVAENFTRATTQAERLKWVRQPTEVAAAMAEFFSTGTGAREVLATLDPMEAVIAGEQTYMRFSATMEDGTQRLLCLVPAAGGWRVDFKAYARHGSVPWAALLAGQAEDADEMRVFIEKGDYYNFEFKHDVRWQSFIATSPDLEAPVWLYLARTDPALKFLMAQLGPQRPARITVDLRTLGESHVRRQFEITRFRGTGWVLED